MDDDQPTRKDPPFLKPPLPTPAFLTDMRVGYDQRDAEVAAAERQQLGAVVRYFDRLATSLAPDHDGLPLDQFPAPLRQLQQDLSDLEDRLRLAATNFDPQTRAGALKLLEAFIPFMERRFGNFLAPLMHLENALRHLDDNVTMPMLKPTSGGKPPVTQTELQRRGVIAAAVDLLRWSGLASLEQAANEVVVLAGTRPPPLAADRVLQWRKDAKAARRDWPDAQAYHQLLAEARSRLRTGEWQAAQLREYVKTLLHEPWP